MKEAVFEIFFLFCQRWCTTGFFCTVLCICMYKHIYTNRHPSVSSGKGSGAPPTPTSTLQKRLGGPKTSKQTRDRRHKVRHFIFLLTFTVFAVVLCGVRSHSPRLPLRPLLKLDPPLPSHSSDEGWKVFPVCGKEEGSDVVH